MIWARHSHLLEEKEMKGLIIVLSAAPMTIGMWMLCRGICGDCPLTYLFTLSVGAFYFWFTPTDVKL
jgi:hypothetical protein